MAVKVKDQSFVMGRGGGGAVVSDGALKRKLEVGFQIRNASKRRTAKIVMLPKFFTFKIFTMLYEP